MKEKLRTLAIALSLVVGAGAMSACESNEQASAESAETATAEQAAEPAEGKGAAAKDDESAEEESKEEDDDHDHDHDVVDSGTYKGTIKEVKPDEKEIYVDVDGKELELYFIEETVLTKNGESAEFSALEKGQSVEVEVKKVGKRLDPISVKIVE